MHIYGLYLFCYQRTLITIISSSHNQAVINSAVGKAQTNTTYTKSTQKAKAKQKTIKTNIN